MAPTGHPLGGRASGRTIVALLLGCSFILSERPHGGATQAAATSSNWHLDYGQSLERESEPGGAANLVGRAHSSQWPAQLGLETRGQLARLFQNGRLPSSLDWLGSQAALSSQLQPDLFNCVEPRKSLYESHLRQFNRSELADKWTPIERLERLNLFALTLKRAILFNRIIQDTVSNRTNYKSKPEIRNYHFIEPTGPTTLTDEQVHRQQARQQTDRSSRLPLLDTDSSLEPTLSLWFADISDCELGLIKKVVFDIFYLIDKNELEIAYRVASEHASRLPLLEEEGFEQLANILLLRLNDRFQGDEKMNQLFQWPLYLKKLAAYAYSRAHLLQADSRAKLALVSFAYPAYFKDLKYNWPAINRTGDNLRANQEHRRFIGALNRKFADLEERNKRLAIFRQRWSLISRLNQDLDEQRQQQAPQPPLPMGVLNILPDWLRAGQSGGGAELRPAEDSASSVAGEFQSSGGAGEQPRQLARAERLVDLPDAAYFEYQQLAQQRHRRQRLFNWTQFSDLTDAEFVAYLNNDYNLLDNNLDSVRYLRHNFPIVALDASLKEELALELELRRGLLTNLTQIGSLGDLQQRQQQAQQPETTTGGTQVARPSLQLARQVVEELIGDVGLPVGPVVYEQIEEREHFDMFAKISETFGKAYRVAGGAVQQQLAELSSPAARLLSSWSSLAGQLSESDLADERQRRFEQFKLNYGRFKAWFIKEGWMHSGHPGASILDERQLIAMLRLADLSWPELKLSLFKICCLNPENLASLASSNATLLYLASNFNLLCQWPLAAPANSVGGQSNEQQQPFSTTTTTFATATTTNQTSAATPADLMALELYYYYSVHFNKHHSSNPVAFERRFAIFRRNLASIRRHSCRRSLALYDSLRTRQFDTLNTIDVLDPRRSFTDDLNLDRFEFFRLEPAALGDVQQQQEQLFQQRLRAGSDLVSVGQSARQQQQQHSSLESQLLTGRAGGISYRRETPFASLWRPPAPATGSRPERLQAAEPSAPTLGELQLEAAGSYARNNAARVYELVQQHYRVCLRTLRDLGAGAEPADESRKRCQANGRLADHTLTGGANSLLTPEFETNTGGSNDKLRQVADQGQCDYYWQGLEPWNEGLTRQHGLSPALIQGARCAA